MIIGQGSTTETLNADSVQELLARALEPMALDGKRVLVIIPDGGEVIIYAPQVTEISYTHGRLIDEIGYHVRDYFVKQWDRFEHVPGGILAHSTHVKGTGTYDSCVETPRIQVTLATGIPEERCRRVNLGYAGYRTIDPQEWAGRTAEGVLLVPHAGEVLYRGESLSCVKEPA
jgi:lactate racemase